MSEQWAAPDGEAGDGPVIDDPAEAEYEPDDEPGGNGPGWVRWVVAALVAAVWVFVVVQLNALNGDVAELTDDFFDDASAIQVTQVASQALVEQLVYLGIGFGVSAVGVLVCLAVRRD